MNQLKDIFLGKKNFDKEFDKLINSQICIRAGGKHNEFEFVGYDSYHLTSFEMLGSWSLLSYGKKHAIELAYNFLINYCGLDRKRLYVTYFMGNPKIEEDIETKNIWKEYVDEDHIIQGNTKDNFWMMGDEGPCGFCTELHYDLLYVNSYSPAEEGIPIDCRNARDLVNKDDPTVVEIWNIVFMQYNKIGNEFIKLDGMYIDTGMGLERLAMVLQDVKSVYDTDFFRGLMGYVQALSKCNFYKGGYSDVDFIDISYRIFCDHIKTCIISVHQGVMFGTSGREFVLRKIFRRLLMYYYLYLNDGLIKEFMNDDCIIYIIKYVLDHFLMKYTSDDIKLIRNKFIEEEGIALNKWKYIKVKYNKWFKKFCNVEETLNILKKNEGIDELFIENIHRIKY